MHTVYNIHTVILIHFFKISSIELVLPGHNNCLIGREKVLESANRHLTMIEDQGEKLRQFRKFFSRRKVNFLLQFNQWKPLSDSIREHMKY